ncbi:MAG: hypothetical protein SFY69_04610 [Planctomycetota bacterium]|nr:hypothetical protein [Planctomycetota bacterium]
MILYLAADLIWATRIKGVADALGLPARPVRTLDMLEARLADSRVSAILLDLEKPDEALAMIERLRRPPAPGPSTAAPPAPEATAPAPAAPATPDPRRVRILAWAPHVERDLMQRARDAGADDVLTRGSFDRNLEDILLRLASRT